jgi:two-component system sensor histidine kinase UhpB
VVVAVAHEALTNVARHSGARRAEVALDRDRGRVILSVRDWGRGLPAGDVAGTGIRGMRERATLIGATLEIRDRRPQPGSEVRLEVPLETPR